MILEAMKGASFIALIWFRCLVAPLFITTFTLAASPLDAYAQAITDEDARGVTASKIAVSMNENSFDGDTYTIKLNTKPTSAVTVTPRVTIGNGALVTIEPKSITIAPNEWNRVRTITVRPVNDDIDNSNRSLRITHTAAGGDYNINSAAAVTVTIIDEDRARLAGTKIALGMYEGGSGSYTIYLTSQPTANVTVTPVVLPEGNDAHVSISRPLVFTPRNWRDPQKVTVTARNNGVDNEERRLIITNRPSGAAEFAGQNLRLDLTITDDDPAPTMTVDSPSVLEGKSGEKSKLVYTVRLNTASEKTVSVRYSISDGSSAQEGVDYERIPNKTVTFPPGSTSQLITVNVIGDETREGVETVILSFDKPNNAT